MEPGQRIGRYELRRELGQGGMGAVWAAFDPSAGREVALKLVLKQASDDQGRARFAREAEALARLRHPGIVTIHEVGEADGQAFLALELVEGRSLEQVVAQDGTIEPALGARLGADLAEALSHAHARGVLHRDVKPANVLVTAEGRARLTDFGLAKDELDPNSLTEPGQVLGTLFYCAPEQLIGKPVDARADQYALGATLFEALCGRPPLVAETAGALIQAVLKHDPPRPSSLRTDLPGDLEAIVLRCLAKAPADRYASSAELAADLVRFLEGTPVEARMPRSPSSCWAPLALGTLAAATLILAGAWVAIERPRRHARAELNQLRAWHDRVVRPWAFGLQAGPAAPAPVTWEELAQRREALDAIAATLSPGEIGALAAELGASARAVRLRTGLRLDPPKSSADAIDDAATAVVDALLHEQRGERARALACVRRAEALRPGDLPASLLRLRLLATDDPDAFLNTALSAAPSSRQLAVELLPQVVQRVAAASINRPGGERTLARVREVGQSLGLSPARIALEKQAGFEQAAPAWGRRLGDSASSTTETLKALADLIDVAPRTRLGPRLTREIDVNARRLLARLDAASKAGTGPALVEVGLEILRSDEVAYYRLGLRQPRGAGFGRFLEGARGVGLEQEPGRFLLATLRTGLSIWAIDAADPVPSNSLNELEARLPHSQAVRFARYLLDKRDKRSSSSETQLAAIRGVLAAELNDLAPIYLGEAWREVGLLLQRRLKGRRRRSVEDPRAMIDAARSAQTLLQAGDTRLLERFGYARRHRWILEAFLLEYEALTHLSADPTQRLDLWERAVAVHHRRVAETEAKGLQLDLNKIYLANTQYLQARELRALGRSWRPLLRQVQRTVEALGGSPEPGLNTIRNELRPLIRNLLEGDPPR